MKKEDLDALKEALKLEVRDIMANYQGRRDAATKEGKDPDAVGLGDPRAISLAAFLLWQSSEEQARAATRLEASSRRLEVLASCSFMITVVLIVFAAASYFFDAFTRQGLSVPVALQLTYYAILLVVAIVAVSLFLVIRGFRRRESEQLLQGNEKEKRP